MDDVCNYDNVIHSIPSRPKLQEPSDKYSCDNLRCYGGNAQHGIYITNGHCCDFTGK